jgi:hypothetical protein
MFASRCSLLVAVVALLALLVAGPRAPAAEPASVTGRITLDGRPLPGGRIIFYVGDDQFVGAKIKAAGTYKLARVPVGRHKVTVEFKGLPARYSEEDKSALVVEVSKGANTLNFDLTSR